MMMGVEEASSSLPLSIFGRPRLKSQTIQNLSRIFSLCAKASPPIPIISQNHNPGCSCNALIPTSREEANKETSLRENDTQISMITEICSTEVEVSNPQEQSKNELQAIRENEEPCPKPVEEDSLEPTVSLPIEDQYVDFGVDKTFLEDLLGDDFLDGNASISGLAEDIVVQAVDRENQQVDKDQIDASANVVKDKGTEDGIMDTIRDFSANVVKDKGTAEGVMDTIGDYSTNVVKDKESEQGEMGTKGDSYANLVKDMETQEGAMDTIGGSFAYLVKDKLTQEGEMDTIGDSSANVVKDKETKERDIIGDSFVSVVKDKETEEGEMDTIEESSASVVKDKETKEGEMDIIGDSFPNMMKDKDIEEGEMDRIWDSSADLVQDKETEEGDNPANVGVNNRDIQNRGDLSKQGEVSDTSLRKERMNGKEKSSLVGIGMVKKDKLNTLDHSRIFKVGHSCNLEVGTDIYRRSLVSYDDLNSSETRKKFETKNKGETSAIKVDKVDKKRKLAQTEESKEKKKVGHDPKLEARTDKTESEEGKLEKKCSRVSSVDLDASEICERREKSAMKVDKVYKRKRGGQTEARNAKKKTGDSSANMVKDKDSEEGEVDTIGDSSVNLVKEKETEEGEMDIIGDSSANMVKDKETEEGGMGTIGDFSVNLVKDKETEEGESPSNVGVNNKLDESNVEDRLEDEHKLGEVKNRGDLSKQGEVSDTSLGKERINGKDKSSLVGIGMIKEDKLKTLDHSRTLKVGQDRKLEVGTDMNRRSLVSYDDLNPSQTRKKFDTKNKGQTSPMKVDEVDKKRKFAHTEENKEKKKVGHDLKLEVGTDKIELKGANLEKKRSRVSYVDLDASEIHEKGETSVMKSQVDKVDKRKRGGQTEAKKAKKKMQRRRKRAEADRQAGVKRLKLEPNPKPKTIKICDFYLRGRCQQGTSCKFSHDTIPLTKSQPCKHFAKGQCLKGDDCPFDHQLSKYPCHFYQSNGFCIRGDGCMFSHKVEAFSTASIASKAGSEVSPLLNNRNSVKLPNKGNGSHQTPCISKMTVTSPSSAGTSNTKQHPGQNATQTRFKPPAQVPKGISFLSFGNVSNDSSSKQQQGDLPVPLRNGSAAERPSFKKQGAAENFPNLNKTPSSVPAPSVSASQFSKMTSDGKNRVIFNSAQKALSSTPVSSSMSRDVPNSAQKALSSTLAFASKYAFEVMGHRNVKSPAMNTEPDKGFKTSMTSSSEIMTVTEILNQFLFTDSNAMK